MRRGLGPGGGGLGAGGRGEGKGDWPLRPLTRKIFARAPELVAPDLIGQLLVRALGGRTAAGGGGKAGLARFAVARIVEAEAYQGQNDPAAHAFRGPTAGNATLFGPPGHAYVYTSYGLHQCLNVSTEPAGRAGCVLIRAAEIWRPTLAARSWLERQAPARDGRRLLSGPGRLCRALGIPRALDGQDLTMPGRLWLAAGPPPEQIAVTRRVGIHKAAERPLRFYDLDSAAISAARGPIVALLTGGRGRWEIA